jgi:hypothetical protein
MELTIPVSLGNPASNGHVQTWFSVSNPAQITIQCRDFQAYDIPCLPIPFHPVIVINDKHSN